jgi:hypothetical protein
MSHLAEIIAALKQLWHHSFARRTRLPALFLREQRGNVLLTFALALPAIFGVAGISIDYARLATARTKMQAVADSAALASAQEFQLAQSKPERVASLAEGYVQAQIDGVFVQTKVDFESYRIQVLLQRTMDLTLGKLFWNSAIDIRVSATAQLSDGLPLCLVALDTKARGTVQLRKSARLTAPNCVVYSNSKNPEGLVSQDNAVLRAGFICTAGGRVKTKDTNYQPQPLTDCPVIADPLASRSGPTDFSCTHHNKVVNGVSVTLTPGVYCGGLKVTNGAQVRLTSGTFVFMDGPLVVDGNASFKGENVALYLKGSGANLMFATASTISLTAPKTGSMAGLLIFDDPSGAPAPEVSGKHTKKGKSPREHAILSDNARTLLGTIYMPKGRLIIDATKPVADRSAYTVLVVQQLDLYDGPNLILNTDYGASEIPVPKGVGPYGGKPQLIN